VLLGLSIPLTPFGPALGFVEPPPGFYVLFALAIAAYLLLVEAVKRHLYGRVFGPSNR
jgi:P-type Mg2+ transporter